MACQRNRSSLPWRAQEDPPLNRREDRVEGNAEGDDNDFRPLRLGTFDLAWGPAAVAAGAAVSVMLRNAWITLRAASACGIDRGQVDVEGELVILGA